MSNDEEPRPELRHCLLCGAKSSPRICADCLAQLSPTSVGKSTQWRSWDQLVLNQQIAISPDFTPTSLVDHSVQILPNDDDQETSEDA